MQTKTKVRFYHSLVRMAKIKIMTVHAGEEFLSLQWGQAPIPILLWGLFCLLEGDPRTPKCPLYRKPLYLLDRVSGPDVAVFCPSAFSWPGRGACVCCCPLPCRDSGFAVHAACGHLEVLWDTRQKKGEGTTWAWGSPATYWRRGCFPKHFHG